MRLFSNPYTGKVMDLDAVPVAPGGAKFCPDTGLPLDAKAVELYSYPGPREDRETWAADAMKTVAKIERQANEPNAATLGISTSLMTSGFEA